MVTKLGFVAYHASCLFGCVERPGVASGSDRTRGRHFRTEDRLLLSLFRK